MKIGIIAQYLDSRNDIREVIEKLAVHNEVYLYIRKNDYKKPVNGVIFREIKSRKATVKNHLLSRLFYLFGKIPRSKNNYYITEAFKIANTKASAFFKNEKKALLFLSKYVPKSFSYDQYLDLLDYSTDTDIEDINLFLFFSEIYDDFLLAHLINAQKKIIGYVYSWDHACKMTKFSKRIAQYLVWNDGLKQDMAQLQDIPEEKIMVLGASQLAYIQEFKTVEKSFAKPFDFEYIYFGCATGTKALVKQEVSIIKEIAKILQYTSPDTRLVVRPYPFLAAWNLYEGLTEHKNIVLDNQYRDYAVNFALSHNRIFEKFTKVKYAKAFIHLGTTMGFEATYFDTPVFQVNYFPPTTEALGINGFIHQYQNDKYLILNQFPNVINSPEEWPTKLRQLLSKQNDFLAYNRHISKQTPLYDFEHFTTRLSAVLHN